MIVIVFGLAYQIYFVLPLGLLQMSVLKYSHYSEAMVNYYKHHSEIFI